MHIADVQYASAMMHPIPAMHITYLVVRELHIMYNHRVTRTRKKNSYSLFGRIASLGIIEAN